MSYQIIFDEIILNQLKKLGEKEKIRTILSKMFDKIEMLGPRAGKLVDSQLFIYEIKSKSPPIRLYFNHKRDSNNIYVFEYELKTSSDKQNKTVNKLRDKSQRLF